MNVIGQVIESLPEDEHITAFTLTTETPDGVVTDRTYFQCGHSRTLITTPDGQVTEIENDAESLLT